MKQSSLRTRSGCFAWRFVQGNTDTTKAEKFFPIFTWFNSRNMKTSAQWLDSTMVLRLPLAVILVMHSIPTIADGTVNGFGGYLNDAGFSPVGVPLAWVIKLAHLVGAFLLLSNRFILWTSLVNIAVFVGGIFMVHLPHGWFVVGRGSNGIEFNVLLIAVLAYLIAITKR